MPNTLRSEDGQADSLKAECKHFTGDAPPVVAVTVCEERIGECFMQAGSMGTTIFSRVKARLSIGFVALGLCLAQSQTWAACSGDTTISTALVAQQIIGSGPGAWQCGLNVTESGSITVTNTNGVNNMSGITLTTLNNNGQISASVSGNGSGSSIENAGTLTTLNNNGQISASGSGTGIYNTGTITTLNNSNQISAAANAIFNRNSGTCEFAAT